MMEYQKKKLFDSAYEAYLSNVKYLLNTLSAENDTNIKAVVIYEIFLQSVLVKIAVADGNPTADEIEFIKSISNSFESLCEIMPGYRRFVELLSLGRYNKYKDKFFNSVSVNAIAGLLESCDSQEISEFVEKNELIFNSMVAIDDEVSEAESNLVTAIIKELAQSTATLPNTHNKTVEKGSVTAIEKLNALVGLQSVKKEVLEFVNLVKVNSIRKRQGLPTLDVSMHMVFTGNPGTGKTTVARIIAEIFKENGVLSKGQLIETDRSGLVDDIIGGTEKKVKSVIKKAKGGVLFIDEAYALVLEDSARDFGQIAISTLVKDMEDNRDDLVVIAAGYENDMKRFIKSNNGLESRFKKYIHFPDYSADEMHQIFHSLLDETGFSITSEADALVKQIWSNCSSAQAFGNGRGVRNVFEAIATKQASRLAMNNIDSKEELLLFRVEDVDISIYPTVEDPVPKRKIGF